MNDLREAPPPQRRPLAKARQPFLWVRRLLLGLGLLGVAGLAVVLLAYNFGRGTTERATSRDRLPGNENAVSSGQNIDYVQTSAGRKVFRVRAARSEQDRADTSFLEQPIFDFFHDDGSTYTITSQKARLNQKSLEALLEGDVVVKGWGDLELMARAIELQQNGQILESRGAVEFRYPPNLIGRASRFTIDRTTGTIELSEGVHIRSVPGAEQALKLNCQKLTYEQQEGLLRASDDVLLQTDDQEISAHFISIYMESVDGKKQELKNLRARFEVKGKLRSYDDAGRELLAEFTAQMLEIEPEPGAPDSRRMKLEGTLEEPAFIKVVQQDGLARSLSGRTIETRSAGERLVDLRGVGEPLRIDEFLDLPTPHYLRRACAGRATTIFLPDGTLGRVLLENNVSLRDEQVQVSGGTQATLNWVDGQVDIEGPMVEMFTARGDVLAPRIRYSRQSGLMRAYGGVQAALESDSVGALSSTPMAAGAGPIRINSEEAIWTQTPPAFTFKGNVRAWREQNLLLASQLRGDQTSQDMAASGGVKTIWIPVKPGRSGEIPPPIEVNAETLTFRRNDNLLIYEGNVSVVQSGRTITCRALDILLSASDGSKAEKLTCRDAVELDDPIGGQRVKGDLAIYTVAEDRIEVFGNEVRLTDSQRNELIGKYLIYDLNTGSAKLRSKAPDSAIVAPAPGSR